ncbi:MAG TPA: SoxR reducing system RseC family protein, partial [Woeseiaceae bacterium]|nr:SoxR reducing system RseC family protein [Woeseiaceae bacterium]
MDRPEAKVIAVGRHRATVSVEVAAACPRCASGAGCGAGLLVRRREPAELEVEIARGISLQPGDRVRLAFLPARLLRAAWLAYGLPLGGIVCGTLLSAWLEPRGELAAVAMGVAGLLAGFLL